jgi:hypothetical protein
MDGRCKDCTLDERLDKLQVLRFIKKTRRDACEVQAKNEDDCALYEGKKINYPE